MCRWLVFLSEEDFLLADVVIEPANSLIKQSFDGGFHPGLCETNNMVLNADGFGLGWYGRSGAAIFRSVTPAWNNRNLRELCRSVESSCVFAHVRAATPGSVISESNCHPFRCGPLLFQHNGHIEQYARIKRRVLAEARSPSCATTSSAGSRARPTRRRASRSCSTSSSPRCCATTTTARRPGARSPRCARRCSARSRCCASSSPRSA